MTSTPMSTLDTALAELARVPPKDFTRTRAALAARLREAGDTKAAARVKARRAPTIPVWVVNRLAHDAEGDVGALISASKDLKAAQLGRRAQPESLGEAAAQRRGALDRLLKRARRLLSEAGTAPNHQMLLRVQTLLTAAAADADLQRALRKGEVEQELAATGFDVFGGAQPQPIGRTAAPKRDETAQRLPAQEPSAKERAADARARARQEQQRRRDERARERAEQRGEREAQRRARLTSARAALESAESEAAAAKQRLAEATATLDALMEQADQARRLRADRQVEARKAERAVMVARRAAKGAGRAAKP